MFVSIEGRDFCLAATRLGETARLLTWTASGEHAELEAAGVDICAVTAAEHFDEQWLADAVLLHLTGADLAGDGPRRALDVARKRQAQLAVDMVGVSSTDAAGARLALDLVLLHPDILLVGEEQMAALGAPLEGLARLPVLVLGDRGVELFGRRVPAPPGAGDRRQAFTAALCSAYLDGAMPVEAAARAMVFAATG